MAESWEFSKISNFPRFDENHQTLTFIDKTHIEGDEGKIPYKSNGSWGFWRPFCEKAPKSIQKALRS